MSKKGGVPENLIPCKPGETANPNGRPKGKKSISTYMKLFIESGLDKLPNDKLRKQLEEQGFDCVAAALAFKKISLALSSSVKPDTQLRAMDSIEDRLEGRPIQKTEITGKDGETLAIESTIYNELNKLPAEKVGRIVDILEDKR